MPTLEVFDCHRDDPELAQGLYVVRVLLMLIMIMLIAQWHIWVTIIELSKQHSHEYYNIQFQG